MINLRHKDVKLDRNQDHLKYYTLLFVVFLQNYFKLSDVGKFKWSPDIDKTEVLIADQDNGLPDSPLPRVITVRGPSIPLPMTFNDEAEPYNPFIGAKKRTRLIQTSITFHCIARTGLETQELAFKVHRAIDDYYMTLQQFGIHKVFRNAQMSSETPANAVFSPEVISEGRLIMVTYSFIYRNTTVSTPSNAPAAKMFTTNLKTAITDSLSGVESIENEVKDGSPDKPGVPFKQPNINNNVQEPEFSNVPRRVL